MPASDIGEAEALENEPETIAARALPGGESQQVLL